MKSQILKWIKRKLNPCPKGGFHQWKKTGIFSIACEEVICEKCKAEAWHYMPPH